MLGHRAQVGFVGRARRLLGRLEPERRGVLAERGDVLVGVLAQRHAGGFCAPAIVRSSTSVKFITWCTREAADVVQRAAQHVEADERPEVADVAAVVDRETARVHAHGVVAGRRERLFLPRQRVVQAHRGGHRSVCSHWSRLTVHEEAQPACAARRTAQLMPAPADSPIASSPGSAGPATSIVTTGRVREAATNVTSHRAAGAAEPFLDESVEHGAGVPRLAPPAVRCTATSARTLRGTCASESGRGRQRNREA